MTDEQLAALMQTGDLGTQEAQMEQQNALAQQLRQQALQPSARRDVGSQLARGLQGGMAGYAMKQQQQGMKDYGAAKAAKLGSAMDILLKRGQQPQQVGAVGPTTPMYDTAGF